MLCRIFLCTHLSHTSCFITQHRKAPGLDAHSLTFTCHCWCGSKENRHSCTGRLFWLPASAITPIVGKAVRTEYAFPGTDSLTTRPTNPAPGCWGGRGLWLYRCSSIMSFLFTWCWYILSKHYSKCSYRFLLFSCLQLIASALLCLPPLPGSITLLLFSHLFHIFYFNHVSVQEMSSATMNLLTVLSVFVCAGVYQSMSKVNLGCPFSGILVSIFWGNRDSHWPEEILQSRQGWLASEFQISTCLLEGFVPCSL